MESRRECPELHKYFMAEPAAQPSFLSPFQSPRNSVPSLIFSVIHNKRISCAEADSLQQVRGELIGQLDFRHGG